PAMSSTWYRRESGSSSTWVWCSDRIASQAARLSRTGTMIWASRAIAVGTMWLLVTLLLLGEPADGAVGEHAPLGEAVQCGAGDVFGVCPVDAAADGDERQDGVGDDACCLRFAVLGAVFQVGGIGERDRKSTRLNSSHVKISYAVFCLKK